MYYLRIFILAFLALTGLVDAMDYTAGGLFFRGHRLPYGLPVKPSMGITRSSSSFGLGELVLMPCEGACVPAIVQEKKSSGRYLVNSIAKQLTIMVHHSELLTLKPLWHCICQPEVSLAQFRYVLEKFLNNVACQPLPFVQSRILESHKKVLVVGDVHGSCSSVAHHLRDWYEKGLISEDLELNPAYMLVYTGDYEDRGPDGIEVLYVLMNLKIANPRAVVMIRGNHEDKDILELHNFKDEWAEKFGSGSSSRSTWQMLIKSFSAMPHVVILGRKNGTLYDCIMCSHGGIEQVPGLLKVLIDKHIESPDFPIINHMIAIGSNNDFNWMDFYAMEELGKGPLVRQSGRGEGKIAWSKAMLTKYLNEHQSSYDQTKPYQYCLRALFRGHEHVVGGIARLLEVVENESSWQKLQNGQDYPVDMHGVYTFTSAPEAFINGNQKYDAYGILSICNNEWVLRPCIRERYN